MAPTTSFHAGLVRVFDADPDFTQALEPGLAERLRRQVLAEVVGLDPGPWEPPREPSGGGLGFLILEGMITRSVTIAGRRGVELLGPGDIVRPWGEEEQLATVPFSVRWEIVSRTWMAALDGDFEEIATRIPAVMAELIGRVIRSRSLATSRALFQMPALETRLMLLFWQLADRWGRVEPDGVAVPMHVNQTTLGDLVGARRQSVSRALAGLIRRGDIERRPGWVVLRADPPRHPVVTTSEHRREGEPRHSDPLAVAVPA